MAEKVVTPRYALGAFCQTVQPFISGVARTKKGFMLDFFDAVMDKETVFVETSKHEKTRKPGKTSITVGVWAGVNSTDLVRFFNGERKIPPWKAGDFHNHLDLSKVEELCDEVGIDALVTFRQQLLMANINIQSASEVPAAIGSWLKQILWANSKDQDLLADRIAPQPQLDLFTNLPLAEGRISGGKLHLGFSSLPWKPPPEVPEVADPKVESGYTSAIIAALEEHLGVSITDVAELPEKYQKAYSRQRGHFWDAEGIRRNLRDLLPEGEQEFSAMKDDLFDGVIETCEAHYDDGYLRMNATLSKAADFSLAGSVLVKFPSMVCATHKKGMCHMLVNDDQLHWVIRDGD
ncbi:ABC-three component system protein [Schaalia turicensis]|uniref:ABC-three component system protein n=1 Tax=Schaalia turicensis TaxID=131111 RepID=UPI001898504D|nr:ABC-three component system protein [Schaalia turicensis]